MGWIDDIVGVSVQRDGTAVRLCRTLNFIGVDISYDQQEDRLDLNVSGGDWKESVRVATVGALPAYVRTDNRIVANANGVLPAQDGVALVDGDRMLLTTGAAGADNGIWSVTSIGSAGTPFELERTGDMDEDADVTSGLSVPIEEGMLYAAHAFRLATPNPIVLNVTALTFVDIGTALPSGTYAGQPLGWDGTFWDVATWLGFGTAATMPAAGEIRTGGNTFAITARDSGDANDASVLSYARATNAIEVGDTDRTDSICSRVKAAGSIALRIGAVNRVLLDASTMTTTQINIRPNADDNGQIGEAARRYASVYGMSYFVGTQISLPGAATIPATGTIRSGLNDLTLKAKDSTDATTLTLLEHDRLGDAFYAGSEAAGQYTTLRGNIVYITASAGANERVGFYFGGVRRIIVNEDEFRPETDNTVSVGTAAKRFALVRATTVTSGDLCFDDETCPLCGSELYEEGEPIVLYPIGKEQDGAGRTITRTVPAHAKCCGYTRKS